MMVKKYRLTLAYSRVFEGCLTCNWLLYRDGYEEEFSTNDAGLESGLSHAHTLLLNRKEKIIGIALVPASGLIIGCFIFTEPIAEAKPARSGEGPSPYDLSDPRHPARCHTR